MYRISSLEQALRHVHQFLQQLPTPFKRSEIRSDIAYFLPTVFLSHQPPRRDCRRMGLQAGGAEGPQTGLRGHPKQSEGIRGQAVALLSSGVVRVL